MDKTIYKDTLFDLYPIYMRKEILKLSIEEGLVINEKNKDQQFVLNLTDAFDVSDKLTLDEKLKSILEEEKIIALLEEYDYKKVYRHFCYFKYESIDWDKLDKAIKNKEISVYDKKQQKPVDTFEQPTIYTMDNLIYLKFSIQLSNNYGVNIRYVTLVVIDKENELLEFRFDKIGIAYKSTYNFYCESILRILNYLECKFGITTSDFDFKAIIEYIKSEKEDVTIYAQKMKRNGSTAYLEAYDEDECTIPILGELYTLIENHSDLFNKDDNTKEIKRIIDEFINNIEIKSDIPVVKVKMDKQHIKFGITHNYKDSSFSLFVFNGELDVNKEMMNDVKYYLMQCYRELNSKTQDEPLSTEEV